MLVYECVMIMLMLCKSSYARLTPKVLQVAYKIQLPPEVRAIINIFHVSQFKKCLRVLEERVEVRDIKLKSDLAYEEKSVQIIDNRDRVTWNRVIKFHKVMWSNHGSEVDATWEKEDYLREVYPTFYEKW